MSQRALPHIITYDIADKKRLGRVFRYLKGEAVHLQYSIFLTPLTPRQKTNMIAKLDGMINKQEDDVRLYPLPKKPQWQAWGQTLWPETLLTGIALPDTKHDLG